MYVLDVSYMCVLVERLHYQIVRGHFLKVHTQIIDEAAKFRRIAIPGQSIRESLVTCN